MLVSGIKGGGAIKITLKRAWIRGGEMPKSVGTVREKVWKEDVSGWVEIFERRNTNCAVEWEEGLERDSAEGSLACDNRVEKDSVGMQECVKALEAQSRRNTGRESGGGGGGGSNGVASCALRARSPVLWKPFNTRHHWKGRFIT